MTNQPADALDFYYGDVGTSQQKLGRKIYHAALSDRRGFRNDQIGIPSNDDVWLDIFDALATAATPSPAALKTVYEALESDYMWNWLEEDKMWPDEMIEHQNKIENARSLLKPFVTEA